ncbi:hypothetical protein J8273_8223 [Carpediemonas membranifera]|uniref:Transposase n=1 Tax=Carpediemonas membranifera TaxID=201153 RepID=A0A8J6AWN9_9EUKA|nr:hypothetical protein J8273_8223 [Carpediemonas membranifera]|eukprot:KAG9390183.1 hypothetical protein J8273_8223 [Carpediemonas membranifera]
MVFIVACSWLIVSSYGVSPSLRAWFTRYANSVKLWLARTVKTYRDRLQGSLARLEEALAGVGSPAFFQQELAGVHAILGRVNPEILACLPSLFWAAHMGENDGLPVSEAAPRILSCVWAIADGVEKLSGLISHFNGEYSMSLRQPRLVPIVPMAPVRPGFMAYRETMGLLNENFCHRVGINPTLPHATNPLTEEQKKTLPGQPQVNGPSAQPEHRWGLCGGDGKRGGRYRPQHDASMPVRKRARGREKERPRLGENNADAPPAPDPDAHLMGFDPGARSIGGYYIKHPDGTSSGVLPKCGYTKTPSFGFDMTAASFKSTGLVSINNSIRFVLDNANDIFEAGMRKSFRRVRFANHILRQKHFARCGQQLAREFGRHHSIATPIRLKVFYGSSGFTTPAGMFIPCAPYRKFAREIVPHLKRYNIVDLNMVNEDRTTVVCPHCHAPYKRVRPRDDQHVHPHRVMLCENPQCRGAQWRATVPDALNVDHRDKSAAENILWRSLATEDELGHSPFSRTLIPRLQTSFQYHQLANRHHSSADG